MNSTPIRRWYQFSVRTTFVLVIVVSIPLAWVGYSLNWIKQRQEWRKTHSGYWFSRIVDESTPRRAPACLWLFGEKGVGTIVAFDDERDKAHQLFPESGMMITPRVPPRASDVSR